MKYPKKYIDSPVIFEYFLIVSIIINKYNSDNQLY